MAKSSVNSKTPSINMCQETLSLPGTESPLIRFVLPYYAVFHYFLGVPSIPLFKFDCKSQKFTYDKITILRKLLGISLSFLAALYYAAALKLQWIQAMNSTLRVMSTVLYMNCILLVIIAPLTLTNSAEKVCQILNGIHELATEMGKRGAKFPCKKHIRIFTASSVVLGAVVMAMFTLATMDGQHGARLREGPDAFASAALNYHAQLVACLAGNCTTTEFETESIDAKWVATVAIFVFTWVVLVLWAAEFLLKAGWALTFWVLLDRFMKLMEERPSANLLKVLAITFCRSSNKSFPSHNGD